MKVFLSGVVTFCFLSIALIVGCGGGGGSDSPSMPTPTPTPTAGASSTSNLVIVNTGVYSAGGYGQSAVNVVTKTTRGLPPAYFAAAWSPDASRFAYSHIVVEGQGQSFRISTAAPDGSNVVTVTSGDYGATSPSWSPDGKQIAFTYAKGNSQQIGVINADGTNLRQITAIDSPSQRPIWSPKGDKIACLQNMQLTIIGTDGTVIKSLSSPLIQRVDYPGSWSPDGTRLVFAAVVGNGYGIFAVSDDLTNLTQLGAGLSGSLNFPAWSPNGRKIAFSQSGNAGIYTINSDGSEARFVVKGGYPSWSPDSASIAYSIPIDAARGVYHLGVVKADGSNPQDLGVLQNGDFGSVWSPK